MVKEQAQKGEEAANAKTLNKPLPWHRGGWAERPTRSTQHRVQRESSKVDTSCEPGPNVPQYLKGPVQWHTQNYVFSHSQAVQHTQRTTFVRSYCPGAYGAPRAEPNHGFFTELDARLYNSHLTLMSLREKASAQQQEQQQGPGSAVEEPTTMDLRKQVNTSLQSQLDFYTSCMSRYCIKTPDCKCANCSCICREAHRSLRQQAFGSGL